jgi:hypothetical protein
MKSILLSTAVVFANFVAMGGVASAQHCNGFGGYGGFGGYRGGYAGSYGPSHYGSFRAIPVGRLPANVVFKAIQTEEGIVIVAVPAGSGASTAIAPNGPNNVAPQINPQQNIQPVAPQVQPQVNPQPQINPQPQVVPPQVTPTANVVQNPTGPSSPFFNIPEQTVPSGAFNGSPIFRPSNTQVVQNGGVRFNDVQNGAARAPNLVNGGAVRAAPGIAPAAAPVNNGATRQFQFNAPAPGNGRPRGR